MLKRNRPFRPQASYCHERGQEPEINPLRFSVGHHRITERHRGRHSAVPHSKSLRDSACDSYVVSPPREPPLCGSRTVATGTKATVAKSWTKPNAATSVLHPRANRRVLLQEKSPNFFVKNARISHLMFSGFLPACRSIIQQTLGRQRLSGGERSDKSPRPA